MYLRADERPAVEDPFIVGFVHGNIPRCNGCKGRISRGEDGKPLPAPNDLVLRHREHVIFQNPNTGLFQQSRDKRNVYYHAQRTCVAPHFLNFVSEQHVQVDPAITSQLVMAHKELLLNEFGSHSLTTLSYVLSVDTVLLSFCFTFVVLCFNLLRLSFTHALTHPSGCVSAYIHFVHGNDASSVSAPVPVPVPFPVPCFSSCHESVCNCGEVACLCSCTWQGEGVPDNECLPERQNQSQDESQDESLDEKVIRVSDVSIIITFEYKLFPANQSFVWYGANIGVISQYQFSNKQYLCVHIYSNNSHSTVVV